MIAGKTLGRAATAVLLAAALAWAALGMGSRWALPPAPASGQGELPPTHRHPAQADVEWRALGAPPTVDRHALDVMIPRD